MLAAWIARAAALARLPKVVEERALPAVQAAAPWEAHIAAAHTAAVVDMAGPRTAAEVVEEASAVVAMRQEPAEGDRNPAEVVAMGPLGFRKHTERAAEALRPQEPPLPAPVRRRKGNLSLRGEHRVRIADISS
jgi:hypothetical protein